MSGGVRLECRCQAPGCEEVLVEHADAPREDDAFVALEQAYFAHLDRDHPDLFAEGVESDVEGLMGRLAERPTREQSP